MHEMLTQTWGVEVEMYSISRSKAAYVLAASLSQQTGVSWYARHRGGSYDAWAVYQDGSAFFENAWVLERDSSILEVYDCQTELVTPIMHWSDMPLLQQALRDLRKAGARSDPAHRCGIHVHVSGEGHTVKSLCNLVNIMASHEQLLIPALALDRSRINQYAKPVSPEFLEALNRCNPSTLSELSTLWYDYQGGLTGCSRHYHPSRYHMLNLHSYFTGKGLEFRLFQFDNYDASAPRGRRGGIHAGQLKAYVQLCLALSYRAKNTRSASYKALETDNPRYAMRCWLLRLGFIGDDFATAREIFTRRLSGDCSFRHGRPKAEASEPSDPPVVVVNFPEPVCEIPDPVPALFYSQRMGVPTPRVERPARQSDCEPIEPVNCRHGFF